MQAPSENPAILADSIRNALWFAMDRHRGQTRDDGFTPYIVHPIAVMRALAHDGIRDVNILNAALLHDVLEDTDATCAEVDSEFGHAVSDSVYALTIPKHLHGKAKTEHLVDVVKHVSWPTLLIKLYDRFDNVSDMAHWAPSKVDWYIDQTQLMIHAVGERHMILLEGDSQGNLIRELIHRKWKELQGLIDGINMSY